MSTVTPPAPSPQTTFVAAPWLKPFLGDSRASYFFDLSLVLVFFRVLAGPYLYRVHQSVLPGGWDGVPHYAIAELYSRQIFPALSAWMPEYFGGMPYPNFYPPLFYFLVAALARLGFSVATAFMAIQTLASCAVPLLTYLCGRRLCRARRAGLVAAILTVGFMVDRGLLSRLGITLHATFDAGLSTQLLSHCFLLLFYHSLLNADRSRISAAISALAFALVPLTNVHMVWIAAFLFLSHAAAGLAIARSSAERIRVIKLHLVMGTIALLLSAVWVLPMVVNLRYVPTKALEPTPGAVLFAYLRLTVYLFFSSIIAVRYRVWRVLALAVTLAVLFAFSMIPARLLAMSNLAIQPARIVVPFPFLMPLLIGYLVVEIRRLHHSMRVQAFAAFAVIAVFFSYFKLRTNPTANVTAEQLASYAPVLEALEGRRDGRVLVEQGVGLESEPFALQSLVAINGAHSLTTVFRESALNVLSAVPLRNSFSLYPEMYGVDHKYDGAEFFADDPSRHLARFRAYNVQYFALHSHEAKERLAAIPGTRLLSRPGSWELHGLDSPAEGYARIPQYEPVLTFASFNVKNRPDYGFDFVRLGEEMFARGDLDVPLVLTRTGFIDLEEGWERFKLVLVTEPHYRDLERAYAALERFSRQGQLVVLDNHDPLVEKIVKLAAERPNVHVIAEATPSERAELGDLAAARQVSARILDQLASAKIPLTNAPTVTAATISGNSVEITLSNTPERPVPVWVKQGYFPNWSSSAGEPMYMATPTFQLTFATRDHLSLRFQQTRVEHVAMVLGALGCLMLLAFSMNHKWRAISSTWGSAISRFRSASRKAST